jgi:hypothetical protein
VVVTMLVEVVLVVEGAGTGVMTTVFGTGSVTIAGEVWGGGSVSRPITSFPAIKVIRSIAAITARLVGRWFMVPPEVG